MISDVTPLGSYFEQPSMRFSLPVLQLQKVVDRWIWKSIADDLRRQAIPHIRGEQRPEVSNMRIVREPAQFDARMPTYVTKNGVKELSKRAPANHSQSM